VGHSTLYVRWFEDLGIADVGAVGGKNASLGEVPSSCCRPWRM
jgi:phosphoenolpyruvate synthase/pyruvate phosphate dikinase